MRSCFRNPLAPGRSKDRAILVSSVMFFSLSSAMVIRHLRGDFLRRVRKGDSSLVGRTGGTDLSSPPLCLAKMLRLGKHSLALRGGNAIQHFIHGFLNAGVGLVKFARRLGRELTQHVTVAQSMQRFENTIRTHSY